MLYFILLIISFSLMLISFFGFYLLSEKQRKKTQHSRFAWLLNNIKMYKFVCAVLCIIATSLLMLCYGSSIGFVAWWIFASPLLLMIILSVNDLKRTEK